MSFGRPLILLLLAVPVLVAVWEALRRGPTATLPFDHGRQGEGRWIRRLLLPGTLLPAALLAVAVFLLARPLRTAEPKQERKLTNIEFLLDVSGSMQSSFGKGSRYDAAMAALGEFTGRRKGDAFGLTIFGNEVLRWTPLTKDLSAVRSAAPFLRPELLPPHFGGTEIGKGLRFCLQTLPQRGEGDRMIVLLSDGESADLGPVASRQIGEELNAERIVLFAIHIGDGQPPADLYDLTRPTGGRVFAAASPEGLQTVFERIDHMRPVEMKPGAPRQVDAFAPFALAGLVLLGIHGIFSFGLRYTPW